MARGAWPTMGSMTHTIAIGYEQILPATTPTALSNER